MSVSDYNTDPDLNTSISGINIAEGCPPSGINNAIRQLMADVKTQVDTDGTTYLPLAGGTMTGTLTFSNGNDIGDYLPLAGGTMTGNIAFPAQPSSTKQLQFKNGDGTLNASVSAFGNEIGIGWTYGSGDGAGLALRSKDYPSNGGGWDLIAKAGSTEVSLSGKTDGSLKWAGNNVITAAGGTMTGNLSASGSDFVIQKTNNTGRLIVRGGPSFTDGSSFYLHGKSESGNPGIFECIAHNGTNSAALIGKPNGTLTWGSKDVECIDSSGTEWVRYTSGIQICWGGANAKQTNNFPKAFKSVPAITVTHVMGNTSGGCFYHGVYATATTFYIRDFDDGTGYSRYIAIGRWK